MILKHITKNAISLLLSVAVVLLANSSLAASKLYFVHSDHLGTPQVLTDENQQVVWEVESQTPFGITQINEDPDGDGNNVEFNLRFPGQYYDKETGLNYNGYRYYDPSHGYTQADPIGILRDYSDPQMQIVKELGIPIENPKTEKDKPIELNHLYTYVNQNPINKYDMFGLDQMNRSPYAPGGPLDPYKGAEKYDACWNQCFNTFNPTAQAWAASTTSLVGGELLRHAPGPGAATASRVCTSAGALIGAWGAGTGVGCGLSCGFDFTNY